MASSSTESCRTSLSWQVHKFGGTSVGDGKCFQRVRDIIQNLADEPESPNVAVVVSAMGGKPKTTDLLLGLVDAAARGDADDSILEALEKIKQKHAGALEILPAAAQRRIREKIDADLADVQHFLRAVRVMRHADERLLQVVSGFGEQWSARILTELMNAGGEQKWAFVDAREVVTVEDVTGAVVCWEASHVKLRKLLAELDAGITGLVITGFIASTQAGGVTTLGRDGSDYSASIFGRLLAARRVDIWSDVDGVLSADPRRVPDAYVLDEVSYQEAMELAYFGAKVIHPKTMSPAIAHSGYGPVPEGTTLNIPISCRNTWAPEKPGTKITSCSAKTRRRPNVVCGFSTVDNVSLLNLEGSGLMGVVGVSARLFQAMHQHGISVSLIAQASSEQSISMAVPWDSAEKARSAVADAFRLELERGAVSSVHVVGPCSIIAAVGDGMSETSGVCGRFLGALGRAGISILCIAQGCSERNISCVIRSEDSTRALRTAHSTFLTRLPLSVGVIGSSTAVASLLSRMASTDELQSSFGVELRLRALFEAPSAGSQDYRMLLAEKEEALRVDTCQELLQEHGVPADLEQFTRNIEQSAAPARVILDLSDSLEVATMHPEWLRRGLHVVSLNLGAAGGDMERWEAVAQLRRRHLTRYSVDVAVGRGLPVLPSLRELLAAGDELVCVEGILSASMSFLLNKASTGQQDAAAFAAQWAEALAEAEEGNLFFADPSKDLSGEYVAQKLLVIGREAGLELRREDIEMDSSLAPGVQARELGAALAPRAEAASSREAVLRLVGRLNFQHSPGKPLASVAVEEVPLTHPFAALRGAALCCRFTTARYPDEPLTLQAPRMDPARTGEALFAEVLRLSRSLGARGWAPRVASPMRRSASGLLDDELCRRVAVS